MIKEDSHTGSTLELRNGLYLLHLRGNPYQRGEAHGRLLAEEIRDSGVCHYFGSFLMELYLSSDFAERVPDFLRKRLGRLIEWWYYSPLHKLLLSETREELFGIADTVGLDRDEVVRAVLAPDIMEHLAAGFLRGGKEALGNYYLGGCSGVYVRGTAVKNRGKALFGRNMDFPGVFVWKYPVLLFNHPTETVEVYSGRDDGTFAWRKQLKQPYVYVSTAGFPGHGLTGMNSSGVAMSAFVCLSRNYSRKLMTFLDFNHYLFTRTDSLEGLRRLLETEVYACASPHTIVFADKNEAFSVEVDAKRTVIVPMAEGFDFHVQTNHYINPLMKQKELEFSLEREYTIGRYRLIKDIMEDNYGRIDIQTVVDTLSCNLDRGTKGPRLLGDFPAQYFTLTSTVFEPESGNFWVAGGKPPAVCYNTYIGFNYFDELGAGTKDSGLTSDVVLPPHGTKNGEARRRIQNYKKSSRPVVRGTKMEPIDEEAKKALYHAALSQKLLNNGRLTRAVRQLEAAHSNYADPSFDYVRAIILLIKGDYQEAVSVFRSLREEHIFSPVKDASLSLWYARALDLIGEREKALTVYRDVSRSSILVKQLQEAVKRNMKKPFTAKELPKTFDYYLMGPLEW